MADLKSKLRDASLDDEPYTSKERAADEEARKDARAGRVVTTKELRKRLALDGKILLAKPNPAGNRYLRPIALDATAATESTDDAPKWQQVALEGEYKGYGDGSNPFTFNRETFDKIVANFRAHPSYKADASGVGSADVAPWDFSHASEYPPVMGDIPVNGAPAQGWVRELKVEVNAEGKASLWALTRWLEPAKSYIKEGRYKWASVAVNLEATDAVSGEALGPVLTSIAMTNSPFIEGMLELAAERRPGQRVGASNYYYSAACTPEDALGSFRSLFGLPLTAGATEIGAEMEKLSGMAAGTIPTDDSIELDDIVGAVRQILGLGVLKTTPEVITEAQTFLKGLAAPETGGVSATSSSGASRLGDQEMDIVKILAGKLGCKETAEAIVATVDALFEFRKTIGVKLDKTNAADSVVLAEVLKLAGDVADLTAKLEAMAQALGVQDPAMAVQKLTDTIANAQKLVDLMPELEALRTQAADVQQQQQTQDVAAARDAHFDGNEKIDSLLVLEHKQIGREKFLAKYPIPEHAHLTDDLSGTRGTPVARVAASGSAVRTPGARTVRLAPSGRGGKQPAVGAIDVSDQPGPNLTAKAMAYVRATVAGADKWDHETLWEHAAKKCDAGKFFDSTLLV